ncbi:MAG: T9SS type A sorting domain-containing protein, partial [Chitinophagaceae bacterium]
FSSDSFSLVGNAQSLHYTFSDSGTYWLQLIASNNLRSDTSVKSIVIYPAIPQRFLGNDTILAAGSTFSKLLNAPSNAFCNRWLLNDTLIASSDSLPASKFGTYICQSTNPSFCLVTDTIILLPCIDSLALPIITRSRDSLFVSNYFTDSFTWFKNGILYKTSRQNFIQLNDSGLYAVMLVRNGHCPKVSLPYKVTSVCLDTLSVPIISRSRDSLFVSNFNGDSLHWFNNGVLVQASASNFIHLKATGTYRVSTIKNFHCTKSSADYTVTSLCIDSLKTPVISRKNDSLFVLNLVADSFVWYHNSINIQASTSNTLPLFDTGTYSVVAYKKYLCPRSSGDFNVHQLSTEIVNYSDKFISLFPSPSDGIVYFTCPLPFTLIVTDALGKTVLKQQEVLPINLPKGIYLFRFILKQQVIIKKVVVL